VCVADHPLAHADVTAKVAMHKEGHCANKRVFAFAATIDVKYDFGRVETRLSLVNITLERDRKRKPGGTVLRARVAIDPSLFPAQTRDAHPAPTGIIFVSLH
jgi:hypothetical protein